jgi:hypothetical protein
MSNPRQGTRRGAYGFCLEGLEGQGADLLVEAPSDWPSLSLEQRCGSVSPPTGGDTLVSVDRFQHFAESGVHIDLQRDPLSLVITAPRCFSDEAILHPVLGVPVIVAAHWRGHSVLHGAAFVHADRAWALVAEREGGKSTMAGVLWRRGISVLSDDLLVVDRGILFAGPRAIDLREEPGRVLGGRDLGFVGARQRWRLHAEEGPAALPLAGIIELRWGGTTTIETLDARERLALILRHATPRPSSEDATRFLGLLALPAWRLSRPRGLENLDRIADQLLAALPV